MPEVVPRVAVRAAAAGDAVDVARLLGVLGADGVDADEAARRLRRGHEDVFLGTVDGRAGGLVAVKTELYFGHAVPVAHITALVTDAQARRTGVARALVETADDWARAHGCAGIELTCGLARTDAHHFYEVVGFERTSYRYWRPFDPDPRPTTVRDEGTP